MSVCTPVNDHLNANSATRPSLPVVTGESIRGDTHKPDSMNVTTMVARTAIIDTLN
jgi:hypothetical protein